MIETVGYVASVEAADAMLKAAKVTLVARKKVGAGLSAVLVRGDVAAVRTAVDVGAASAKKVGKVVSAHVIPRPDAETEKVVPPPPEAGTKAKTQPKKGERL